MPTPVNGALPIAELVSLNVEETLKGVSTSAGFNVTLDVERYKKNGNSPLPAAATDLKAVVCDGSDELQPDEQTPPDMTLWRRPYEILIYVQESEASDVPYEQVCNVARADAEKALMADVYRGGYARNTVVRDPLLFTDANDASGVMVRIEVLYWHRIDDPYTVE